MTTAVMAAITPYATGAALLLIDVPLLMAR
jgi:hypothetical protein